MLDLDADLYMRLGGALTGIGDRHSSYEGSSTSIIVTLSLSSSSSLSWFFTVTATTTAITTVTTMDTVTVTSTTTNDIDDGTDRWNTPQTELLYTAAVVLLVVTLPSLLLLLQP